MSENSGDAIKITPACICVSRESRVSSTVHVVMGAVSPGSDSVGKLRSQLASYYPFKDTVFTNANRPFLRCGPPCIIYSKFRPPLLSAELQETRSGTGQEAFCAESRRIKCPL